MALVNCFIYWFSTKA